MNDEPIIRPPQEQEVFQRVWRRVMEGRSQQDSPIETAPVPQTIPQTYPQTLPETYPRTPPQPPARWVDGDMSCDYLAALAKAMPERRVQDQPVNDLPQAGLESPGGEHTARLRQQTLEALEAWQFYRHLARRTRGNTARTLTNMAADQHQLARKLAAAYFIHSGVRYWPSEQLTTPTITSYWGALRQRHQTEQQTELSYRMAMDDAGDDTLAELYGELTESCRTHCRQLRSLLEQSCP